MDKLKAPTYYRGAADEAKHELFKFCAAGEFDKVESLLKENVNIYQAAGNGYTFVPLFVALCDQNQKLAELLLDVYERDLEALAGTKFDKALVAFPVDQTEEFWKTVETNASEDVVPVLIKNSNFEIPKCVYLRKKLKDRDDSSLKLTKDLETKNGYCDLNWKLVYYGDEESFLHVAIYHEMKSVVRRILNHPTLNVSYIMSRGHNYLHYAVFKGDKNSLKILIEKSGNKTFYEDPSYLYQAAVSGKQSILDFMINLLLESGKTMEEILSMPFPFTDWYVVYNCREEINYLFHVMAEDHISLLLNYHLFNETTSCKQNSKGETVLHLLIKSTSYKVSEKVKFISKLVEKFPKLLLIEDRDHRLPLHVAALFDTKGQRIYQQLLELTIKESGNPQIFYGNMETAICTLEKAIEINKGLSEEYLRNFEDLLRSHGSRLLHKTIQCDKGPKCLKGILASSVKINPNNFYNGSNGFLLMVFFDIESLCYEKPNQVTCTRLKMLHDYHTIEDANVRDESGTTLFMYIVGFCEDNELIKSLIENGADCKATREDGITVMHFAATNARNKEIVKILLEHGADPNSLSIKTQMLPIHYGVLADNPNGLRALLPLTTDEKLQEQLCDPKQTFIQYARCSYNKEALEVVWKEFKDRKIKIDVNAEDENGNNLPMNVLENQNAELLAFILADHFNEIDFEKRNKSGETFTHKFAKYSTIVHNQELFDNHQELKRIVNEQMYVLDGEGKTPMEYLVTFGNYEQQVHEDFTVFFLKRLTPDNVRKGFHLIARNVVLMKVLLEEYPDLLDNLEPERVYKIFEMSLSNFLPSASFDFFLEKLADKVKEAESSNHKNILHLVFSFNCDYMIDPIFKVLSEDERKLLLERLDDENKKPSDYLDEENKLMLKSLI